MGAIITSIQDQVKYYMVFEGLSKEGAVIEILREQSQN